MRIYALPCFRQNFRRSFLRFLALTLLLTAACAWLSAQATAPPAPAASTKQLGSIRTISGSDISLATDLGAVLAVKVQPGARIFRTAPGAKDLKGAAPIQLTELQVGDRVLVLGKMGADAITLDATSVVVMKQQDIAQKKQQDLLDWQRRSVGGVVKAVDAQAGSITLSVGGAGGNKTVVVSTTAKTTCKRYAPDSVKWEDATNANLGDIHPGDQLRAKGNKNEDGTQLVAEEIVDGTFRNIAGLVTAVDAAQGTLTVQDLATKKPVTVKITADSQMKKLTPQLAQGLAMRLKNGTQPGTTQNGTQPSAAPPAAAADGARQRGGDLNQMLGRLPASTLGDMQKGDAVMIVSTVGSAAQAPVAVTLLGGVEPILTASPSQGAQSFLTPWSLASAPGGDQQ
jgi:co-chaperonin GroES (HSP10)